MSAAPRVRQAAVIARDGALVAYLVGPSAPSDVRAFVADRLPSYMVPALYTVVESLPLTVNGKLDTAALPAPTPVTGSSRPPRDDLERKLCALFAEAVGVADFGVADDFFDAGGHSLTAMRLLGRVRAELGADVSLRELFDARTAERLALAVRSGTGGPVVGRLALSTRSGTARLAYADYVLALEEPASDVDFWRDALRGLPDEIALSADRPRVPGRLSRSARRPRAGATPLSTTWSASSLTRRAARRSLRRTGLSRIAAPGARRRPGRVRTCRAAVPAGRRAGQPTPVARPEPAVPGDDRVLPAPGRRGHHAGPSGAARAREPRPSPRWTSTWRSWTAVRTGST